MKRWLIDEDRWFPLVIYAILVIAVLATAALIFSGSDGDSHGQADHHSIAVIERKVDRIKAKQSAQIAADRRTLHQLTEAMQLLGR